MGLIDNAVLNISTGQFYLAPVSTARPAVASLGSVPVAWTSIGHTSVDNVFGITSEGGEVTTLASLQNKALRTSRTPTIESFTATLLQFDVDSLKLYFGSNSVSNAGWLDVQTDLVPTTAAFLAVFADGVNRFGIYAAKAEIQRTDSPEFNDSSALSGLPISIKPLVVGNATSAYSLTPMGTVGS